MTSDFQVSEQWEINFCCFQVIQSMVLSYSSPNAQRQCQLPAVSAPCQPHEHWSLLMTPSPLASSCPSNAPGPFSSSRLCICCPLTIHTNAPLWETSPKHPIYRDQAANKRTRMTNKIHINLKVILGLDHLEFFPQLTLSMKVLENQMNSITKGNNR
jgi:hypothetical protein